MPRVIVAVIGAGLLATTCVPIGKSCTEIGCVNGLWVRFSQEIREPGSYRFEIQLDGVSSTCTAALPLPPCSSSAAACTSPVGLGLSGCALPADQHSISELRISTQPRKVDITVTRNDAPFASGNFDVSYTRSTPNGEDCEPVCHQADVELVIP